MFFLRGTKAGFTINGGGTVNLSADTTSTNPYKGVLIYQDPTSNVGAGNTLNGGSSTTLTGALYTPTQSITINGSGTFGQTSPYMPMIADTLKFTGNSTVNLDTTKMTTAGSLPTIEIGARLIN